MKKKENRHGKHHEDLVQIAGYITPELKALAQVTANELRTNMMDIINGAIKPKYKPIIDAYADAYRAKKETRKQQKGN